MKIEFENGSTIEAIDRTMESNGIMKIVGIDIALNDSDNSNEVCMKHYIKNGKVIRSEIVEQ